MRGYLLHALTAFCSYLKRPEVWLSVGFCWIASEVIAQRSGMIDFTVYLIAAERLAGGTSLYATMIDFSIPQTGDSYSLPYLYPPFFALLFLPLLLLGIGFAKVIWVMAMMLSFIVAATLLFGFSHDVGELTGARRDRKVFLIAAGVMAFRPIWYSLLVGQPTGLLCLLLIGSIFLVRQGRSVAAGVVVALMAAMKITPVGLFLLPLFWKDWRMLAAGLVTAILLVLALVTTSHGVQALTDFFIVLPQLDLSLSRPTVILNISPLSILTQPVETVALRPLAAGIAFAMFFLPWILILYMRFRKMPMYSACIPAVLAVSICSPIVWTHHMPLLGVALALYLVSPVTGPFWRWCRLLSGIIVYVLLAYGSIITGQFSDVALQIDLIRIIPNVALLSLLFVFAIEKVWLQRQPVETRKN